MGDANGDVRAKVGTGRLWDEVFHIVHDLVFDFRQFLGCAESGGSPFFECERLDGGDDRFFVAIQVWGAVD